MGSHKSRLRGLRRTGRRGARVDMERSRCLAQGRGHGRSEEGCRRSGPGPRELNCGKNKVSIEEKYRKEKLERTSRWLTRLPEDFPRIRDMRLGGCTLRRILRLFSLSFPLDSSPRGTCARKARRNYRRREVTILQNLLHELVDDRTKEVGAGNEVPDEGLDSGRIGRRGQLARGKRDP